MALRPDGLPGRFAARLWPAQVPAPRLQLLGLGPSARNPLALDTRDDPQRPAASGRRTGETSGARPAAFRHRGAVLRGPDRVPEEPRRRPRADPRADGAP